VKRLVLVGGGHAHIEVLRELAARPADGIAVTLVTPFPRMVYTGMLRRSPDPQGFTYWVSQLDGGNPGLALINGFLGAAEYRARFL